MRYFKLVGAESYGHYVNGSIRLLKKGQFLSVFAQSEAEKFEKMPIFVECDKAGSVAHVLGTSPAERITSKEIWRRNPAGQLEKA